MGIKPHVKIKEEKIGEKENFMAWVELFYW